MSAEGPLYFELHALEIRLLKIAPGGWHDEIECELIHTSLPNKPVFDALSYAWGSPKLVRSIFLNRERREVTASAHQALRRLRQIYGTATVWIDALCINQSDDKERTHQVGLMRDIFTNARQVIVYLGEVQNSKSKVPSKSMLFQPKANDDILSSFATRYSLQDGPKIPKMDEAPEVFCLIHSIAEAENPDGIALFDAASGPTADSKYHRHLFEALRQLMRCRWWDRMWTLQEAVVPKDVTIIYGSCVSTWDMFARAAKAYSLRKASKAISVIPLEYTKVLNFYSQTVLGIETMRNRWTSYEQTTLLSLLRQFSGRKATDPRDRVYALLGLLREDSPVLSDYSIDVAAVYERTALGIISSTGSLSILNGDIGRKSRQDLPSWVPDWSAEYHDLDRQRSETVDLYRATCKSPFYVYSAAFSKSENPYFRKNETENFEWNYFQGLLDSSQPPTRSECMEAVEKYLTAERRLLEHLDTGILKLQGYVLDQVLAVGPVNISETDLIPTIQSWAILATRRSETPIEWSTFMRTLCGDIVYPKNRSASGCRRISHEDLYTIALWFIHEPRSPFAKEEAAKNSEISSIRHSMVVEFFKDESFNTTYVGINVEHSILMATSRRSFFMTDNGSFGMGPAQMSSSDLVYALLGAQTPFILRPADRSFNKGRKKRVKTTDHNRLIGDCFLFGAMDGGEAIKVWQEESAAIPEHVSAGSSEAWIHDLRSILPKKPLMVVALV